jgi:signal transduction histidine kinase
MLGRRWVALKPAANAKVTPLDGGRGAGAGSPASRGNGHVRTQPGGWDFAGVVEQAHDAILVVDGGGRIQLINRAAASMFGYDDDSPIGERFDSLVSDEGPFDLGDPATGDPATGDPATAPEGHGPGPGAGSDLWARRTDGTQFPVEITPNPAAIGDGRREVVIVRDVTHRLAHEQDAREELVLANAERIGSELHNHIISRLFTAGMGIQVVLEQVDGNAAERLGSVVNELDIVIREIRNTLFA